MTKELQNEERNNSTGSGDESSVDDRCQSVCYDQQARTYLRYQAFATIYVVNDVKGLLDQKKE